MNRSNLWSSSLLMVALTTMACGQDQESPLKAEQALASQKAAVVSQNKVLILGSTISGGLSSREAQAVAANAPDVRIDIVTPAQWALMTAEQFMAYRAIILGDASCQSGEAAFQAAITNRGTWGTIVDGNVAIIGTNPTTNHTPLLVENAIQFVLDSMQWRTGIYISLSCAYQSAPAGTAVTLLEPFGTFKVQGVAGCADAAHMFRMYPNFVSAGVSDSSLVGDGCVARSVFTEYPVRNFTFAAIARRTNGNAVPSEQLYSDFLVESETETFFPGAPYVLVRGASNRAAGCGLADWSPSGEECDMGDGFNGQPASDGQDSLTTCSNACRLDWCGDGQVNTEFGEECDDGMYNGRSWDASGTISACTASCKLPQIIPTPPRLPPVARCQNVTAVAQFTCGMAAGIDNGSFDPDNDLVGCTQSPAGPYAIGDTTVTLTCADQQGQSSSCTGVVTVEDRVKPVVTLSGSANQSLECDRDALYAGPGASASDLCSGAVPVSTAGAVPMSSIGAHTLTYTATDSAGNTDSATRNVVVEDTLAPTVTLNGPANQLVECNDPTYVDLGATANDQCNGPLPVAIVAPAMVGTPGSYAVLYKSTDSAGNVGFSATPRTVTVRDTLPPQIHVRPGLSVLECNGTPFVDPGATASDACAGDLTLNVTTTSNLVPARSGQYTVTYSVADASGNVASAARTVNVADTRAPVLTLNGASAVALECGVGSYTEAGATAADSCAGNLTSAIVTSGSVNAAARGTYTKTYSVADASGNVASAARTVNVADTLAPSIALVGASAMRLECGVDSFVNPGATAVDVCSGILTPAIVASGAVNTAAVGNYPVTYRVADGAGNVASVSRTVQVADARAPVLTLNGASTVTLECGVGSYSEAGATAADACAGNLTSAIVTSGTVNAAARGTYTKSYSVTDASGNVASAARTVNVADTRAPAISLVGSATMSVNRGSTFTDPGATATDSCSGNLTSAIVRTGTVNTSVAGSYTLTYSATDGAGLHSSVTRTVTVVGSTCNTTVTVKPVQQIWPPNHSYQNFTLSDCAVVTTNCGPGGGGCHNTAIDQLGTIISIYSDEVEDAQGNGDGSTVNDIVITGPSSFKLRAERQGKGNGRFYGVTFRVTDTGGNVQTATCKFVVPHDQSGRGAVDNGAAAGYTEYR